MIAWSIGRLARDVELVLDSGTDAAGDGGGPRGAPQVEAALRRLQTQYPDAALDAADVNGARGWTVRVDGRTVAVIGVETRRSTVSRVWVVTNPDKLRHWNSG